jgi:hypothetical protein
LGRGTFSAFFFVAIVRVLPSKQNTNRAVLEPEIGDRAALPGNDHAYLAGLEPAIG